MNVLIDGTGIDVVMYDEVVKGLSKPKKSLPSKYFYDKRGSELFEAICDLEEYYLTRAELNIMENNIDEIAGVLGKHVQLVELGSGSSRKTRMLLDNLEELHSYVPVDISEKFLEAAAEDLKAEYPDLTILPVAADYTHPFDIPGDPAGVRKIAYFPGSTIGNFAKNQAQSFMEVVAEIAGPEGGLLIGFDLKKEVSILEKAYNDSEGITEAFNKNILVHLNRKLGADFNPGQFEHKAFFNEAESRMEMHLVSHARQQVHVNGKVFYFEKGETIHTENSHKYSLESFRGMTAPHFKNVQTWTDENELFAIQFLR